MEGDGNTRKAETTRVSQHRTPDYRLSLFCYCVSDLINPPRWGQPRGCFHLLLGGQLNGWCGISVPRLLMSLHAVWHFGWRWLYDGRMQCLGQSHCVTQSWDTLLVTEAGSSCFEAVTKLWMRCACDLMYHLLVFEWCYVELLCHALILTLTCWQPAPVKITFGYGPTEDCGIMLYHRNRLIKAYEKVGCQKQVTVLLLVSWVL